MNENHSWNLHYFITNNNHHFRIYARIAIPGIRVGERASFRKGVRVSYFIDADVRQSLHSAFLMP